LIQKKTGSPVRPTGAIFRLKALLSRSGRWFSYRNIWLVYLTWIVLCIRGLNPRPIDGKVEKPYKTR